MTKRRASKGRMERNGRLGAFGRVALVGMVLSLGACGWRAMALGEDSFVETRPVAGGFALAGGGAAAIIQVSSNDFVGVRRAARDLAADVARVTGCMPVVVESDIVPGTNTVLAGTIGRNPRLAELMREGKIDLSRVAGQWESFVVQVVRRPWPGVENALVIAGSDKRGTIYGLYEVSEQIGVSPWYWWADVPVRRREHLSVKPGGFRQGPPAVKYRGIFLNDEAPCLTGWVNEKFGDYNHQFYAHVFELLLRLRANYLWPAMWNNCFNQDDPLNPKLADEYGIVMGTSHVEPMMRADKEWNRQGHAAAQWNYDQYPDLLRPFWRAGLERNRPYENLITIAMRGKIDTPMSESANIALLERIVADQRRMIAEVYQTNAPAVPQLWALYKEVQEYYEKGMRVPDDVTLLWCDDNWGNLRRLPTAAERGRAGGAGVYYHFDYVGGPRNYKWINTSPLPRIWEQMRLASEYGADRVWIVNVGDLKPMEVPMEFFLRLAWNPQRWTAAELGKYLRLWAEREFGAEHAAEIAEIVTQYARYNSRRKPELLEPGTFSLLHYQEAERVVADWNHLARKAESIERVLPETARNAFFELVLYPAKAGAIVNELYVAAARNRLYARQGRAGANAQAERVRTLFQADADLARAYHRLAGGKWNHMMEQTHIGYTSWQQPPTNQMPQVTTLELPEAAEMGVALEGSDQVWPGAGNPPVLPPLDPFNQRRYLEVFNRGRTPFEFTAAASAPWILLSASSGQVAQEQRLWIGVDWARAPKGSTEGRVILAGPGAGSVSVTVPMFNPRKPARQSLRGFVETAGHVSIQAEHFSRNVPAGRVRWEKVDGLGRAGSAMTIVPGNTPSVTPPKSSPCLEYRIHLFSTGRVEVASMIAPTLNFVPGRGLRLAVSFDDEPPQVLTAVPAGFFVDNGNRDWEESVRNNCRTVRSVHSITRAGSHTLRIWMVDPAVVLEKLVVDLGGVKPSYLGPPESYHR